MSSPLPTLLGWCDVQLGSDHVRVSVPATSANLGPGFDALGLGLELRDTVEVRAVASDDVIVEVFGEGAGEVPLDETHLVARAVRIGLDHVGAPPVGLRLTCHNVIPHGRGLGSSAAAAVAGLVAARMLIAEPEALDDTTILELATELEGHPDNAAAAILGGATAAWTQQVGEAAGLPRAVRLALSPLLDPVVLIPDVRLATSRARAALPATVAHADAAFNVGRAALLVSALAGYDDHLLEATADRLHQQYRADQMPQSLLLVDRLRAARLPALVSGAGPTVLILATRAMRAAHDQVISDVLGQVQESGRTADGWRVIRPGIATAGAWAEVVN